MKGLKTITKKKKEDKETEGKWAKFKQMIRDGLDKYDDAQISMARREFQEDWMRMTEERYNRPCRYWEEIEFNDPEIRVQWELCNPHVLFGLKHPERRAEILGSWSPDMLEVYYRKSDKGNSYSDLEKGIGTIRAAKSVGSVMKNKTKKKLQRKQKNGETLTDLDKQILKVEEEKEKIGKE